MLLHRKCSEFERSLGLKETIYKGNKEYVDVYVC